MSLKSIFQQGMQERRRRKALGKKARELKEKEKSLEELLTALGRKAWESKEDISRFKDLGGTLAETQQALDDLAVQADALQTQQQKIQDRRTRENDRFETERKGVEGKKHDLDKRIKEQSDQLEEDQKETRQARARLAAIALERSQLKSKAAEAALGEEEKADAARKLDLLDQEERALQAGINAREEAGKPVEILVSSLREESDQIQKQLDELRKKQKEVVGDLDKQINTMKNDLSQNTAKVREIKKAREGQYHDLGVKLADSGAGFPKLEVEKAAVEKVRGEQTAIQAEIAGLENELDESQVSAYKKMLALIIGGILLLVAIVVALVLLLSPKKAASSLTNPGGRGDKAQSAPPGQAEISKQQDKIFGDIKKRSEEIHGGEITVASAAAISAALPRVSGWQAEEPDYQRSAFRGMESATLETRYVAGNDRVRVHITDAGTASSMLTAFKMALSMKITIDNEERYSKVSAIKGIPVVERLDKRDGEAGITLAVKDRYLIELTTEAEDGLGVLRQFVASMDLAKLP